MLEVGTKTAAIRRTALVALAVLALVLAASPATSADGVDPEADAILREMSDYLAGLAAFSADADVDNEVLDRAGQKLQLSSSASVVLERPSRIRMSRQGGMADVEVIFDGKSLTIHSKTRKPISSSKAPAASMTRCRPCAARSASMYRPGIYSMQTRTPACSRVSSAGSTSAGAM